MLFWPNMCSASCLQVRAESYGACGLRHHDSKLKERSHEHTLTVGSRARIEANVRARAVSSGGTLSGSVSVLERFELQPRGTLTGMLEAARVQISDGAMLNAKVAMPPRKPAAARAATSARATR